VRLAQQGSQHGDLSQFHIEALTADGMGGMGGIADEGKA